MGKEEMWKTAALSQTYLAGVRGAIPLAKEQIDILLRVMGKFRPRPRRFLDLGCGDGVLAEAILRQHKLARGVLADFSPPMLAAAQVRLISLGAWVEMAELDFRTAEWRTHPVIQQAAPFDVIVSGLAIHHVPDERKRELYAEIYELLTPGGVFLNLEHVASATADIEKLFEELFIDHLWAYHQKQGSSDNRQQIADAYYNRPDKAANLLAPVETQCDWLREIGFNHVDCFFKIFELALFGGVKSG